MAELNTSAYNKAFAVNPMASDAVVLGRNGNFGIALTDKGLMQMVWDGNNTATKYRMNPLVMVVRCTWNANKYTPSVLYDPFKLYDSLNGVKRPSQGRVQIYHKLGHIKYSVSGTGFNASDQCYISVNSINTNYVQVSPSYSGSSQDFTFDLAFYDYGTY